jgi:S-methylmethionine-dependent homocysteine/selenocysteine methylase
MDPMTTADTLAARLAEGPPILIDGGTGTEIERMGATLDEEIWSARAALTDPEIVQRVHSAYLDAGAEIIIANTYSCNYHMMLSAGFADEFESANQKALYLAGAARKAQLDRHGRQAWVAGSMSTTTLSAGLDRSVIEEASAPGDGYRAQADIIADSGVDLIMLEMMRDVTETRLCLAAALETGLPVWLGFSAERGPEGDLRLYGSQIPFEEGLERALDRDGGPQAVGVMHSELDLVPNALQAVRKVWDGPVYAYPHHGVFEIPNWRFDNTLTPDEFATAAMKWVASGARAVGGCCGIRPAHIVALRSAMDRARR